jgi:hypothetical protein
MARVRKEDNRVAILVYLLLAFNIWMIVDAIRRRVEPFWYIILLFPAGAVIYFFLVKVKITEVFNIAPRKEAARQEVEEKEEELDISALEKLRKETEASPSFANRLKLAKVLFANRQFEEAATYFALARKTHPKEKEPIYGLGLCQLEMNQSKAAIETLSELVDQNLEYDDYKAAQLLAQTLWYDGQRRDAFSLLEEIQERSPEIRHRITIAHYLIKDGLKERAIEVLEEALLRFNRASDYIRKREDRWASEARGLLRDLKHDA